MLLSRLEMNDPNVYDETATVQPPETRKVSIHQPTLPVVIFTTVCQISDSHVHTPARDWYKSFFKNVAFTKKQLNYAFFQSRVEWWILESGG